MNSKLFDDSSVTEDNRPISGTKVAYAKKNGEEEAGRNCMNKRRLTNDVLSKVRQAAIDRPRYYQTKPDLLLAICDELIVYRASGFTSVEVRRLADAQEQGRILFAINDDDETHVSSQLERGVKMKDIIKCILLGVMAAIVSMSFGFSAFTWQSLLIFVTVTLSYWAGRT